MVMGTEAMAAAAAKRQAQATKLLPPGGAEGQVRMWRVNAFKKVEVPTTLHGLFYAGDTYIVHYSYTVRQGITRHRHSLNRPYLHSMSSPY